MTREHGDVDLAVRLSDRPAIDDLLIGDGWQTAPDDDVDDVAVGAGYRRDDVLLELTFVETDDEGRADPVRRRPGGLVDGPVRRRDALKDFADHEWLSRL